MESQEEICWACERNCFLYFSVSDSQRLIISSMDLLLRRAWGLAGWAMDAPRAVAPPAAVVVLVVVAGAVVVVDGAVEPAGLAPNGEGVEGAAEIPVEPGAPNKEGAAADVVVAGAEAPEEEAVVFTAGLAPNSG
jgi:hypothetical protein